MSKQATPADATTGAERTPKRGLTNREVKERTMRGFARQVKTAIRREQYDHARDLARAAARLYFEVYGRCICATRHANRNYTTLSFQPDCPKHSSPAVKAAEGEEKAMSTTTADPAVIGGAALGRGAWRQRTPNMTARGENLNGRKVNYDATTGDVLRIGGESYDVIDTYPNGVRLERKTQYGPETTERTYRELLEAGAIFSDERD